MPLMMPPSLSSRLRQMVWVDGRPELAGVFGFWLCVAVAAWSLITWSGQRDFGTAAWSCLFYIVGGVGVRQRSIAAAVILLMWHLLGQIGDLLLGLGIGIVPSFITMLLVLNLRNTWVAWRATRRTGDAPVDNRVAMLLWKAARYPFLIVGTFLVVVSLLGTVSAVYHRGSASSLEPVHGAPSR
jgi:hypothetical protein